MTHSRKAKVILLLILIAVSASGTYLYIRSKSPLSLLQCGPSGSICSNWAYGICITGSANCLSTVIPSTSVTPSTQLIYAPNGTGVTIWLQLNKTTIWQANPTANLGNATCIPTGPLCPYNSLTGFSLPASYYYNNATGILSYSFTLTAPYSTLTVQGISGYSYKLLPGNNYLFGLSATAKTGGFYENLNSLVLNYYLGSLNPRLTISISKTAISGQSVTFTATPSGSASPYTVNWNFGDTYIASNTNVTTTATVTHAYTSAGTYNVNVTAIDAAGRSTTTTSQIVVSITGTPTPIEALQLLSMSAIATLVVGASLRRRRVLT